MKTLLFKTIADAVLDGNVLWTKYKEQNPGLTGSYRGVIDEANEPTFWYHQKTDGSSYFSFPGKEGREDIPFEGLDALQAA